MTQALMYFSFFGYDTSGSSTDVGVDVNLHLQMKSPLSITSDSILLIPLFPIFKPSFNF